MVLIGALGTRVDAAPVHLNTPWVEWEKLEDRITWRDENYESAAFSVRKRCQRYERVSPIVCRLAVGRIALGDDLDRVERDLARSGLQPRPHVEALVALATSHERCAPLLSALARVSRLRRPLPVEAVLRALELPADHPDLDLFTACVGYEQADGSARWSESVLDGLRDALRQGHPREVDDTQDVIQQHHSLAAACKMVDGVDEPERAKGLAGLRFWSEKVHHLARSGSLGAEEWEDQDVRQSEQLWERARTLSWLGRYDEAAQLYRRCTPVVVLVRLLDRVERVSGEAPGAGWMGSWTGR
ncbi:MAG: hypothetical protein EA397_17365 [Deltaproteobacteria bacterium]|nr:MAG: hypothetical protein EA397_17365 [Deltaproteobacteria bacterium]